MLEGLAAWVLNTYVGEYLENLNTDQLSIGLLQGAVELENLPLKKDALRGLDLPVEVKAGFVGKITLQIPMRRLRSEPWVISIDKLYLIAGPVVKGEYNEEKEKERQQQKKKKQLDALEAKWRTEKQDQTGSSSSWYSYSASLVTNIIENLQLNIRDVHIRYEDSTTIPNQPFVFGITITELSAQSTDSDWVPRFVSRDSADMMLKLVELKAFAMYWDVNCEFVGDLPMTQLADALQRNMFKARGKDVFQDHEYILEPVSAQAKIKRNLSALPLRSRNSPRLACDLALKKIPLALSESQYRGILAMIKESERYDRARKYRKWRPMSKPRESKQEWWRYAYSSILSGIEERNRKQCWSYVLRRAKDNVLYVDAYSQYLTNPALVGQPMEHKEKMEEELSFEEIRILREVAMERVRKQEALAEAAKEKVESDQTQEQQGQYQGGIVQRWFPGWGGWYSYSTATTETDTSGGARDNVTASDSMPAINKGELEEELLDALGDSSDDDTFMKRDSVFALLTFSLKSGTFQTERRKPSHSTKRKWIAHTGISTADQVWHLGLEFADVSMSFESRPRSRSMLFNVSLGALYLRDLLTVGSIYRVLAAPQQGGDESSSQMRSPYLGMLAKTSERTSYMRASQMLSNSKSDKALFVMTYEKRPPHSHADYRLEITTRPLYMIYNPKPIRRVSEFFSSKQTGMTSRPSELHLTKAARIRYEELKNQTRAELLQAWDQMLEGETIRLTKRWDIHMDISAPQIIVPDNFHAEDATLVVLDFGHLEFANANAKGMMKKKMTKEDNEEEEDPLDDDDDFATPLSTPPTEMDFAELNLKETDKSADTSGVASEKITELDSSGDVISESALREKFYDKYTLDMSDLQVLVGKAKDNWKSAHVKGTSAMHVVDRFTISVQLERRIVPTTDPQWPSVTLSGTLPKLVLHVNENKIYALRKCVKMFSDPKHEGLLSSSKKDYMTSQLSDDNLERYFKERDESLLELESADTHQTGKEVMMESRQLLMQFSVDQMSLELQSRGRSIAELQVSGVRANLTKRPYDMSVALTVHGLLLVDALQMFGDGYELLLASHKNLSMDVPSGKILDSDPSSPTSPHSPSSPQSQGSPTEHTASSTTNMPSSFESAFTSLKKSGLSDSGTGPKGPPRQFSVESVDSEALISIEFETISPNCPTMGRAENETLQIASLQFNNLDITANQETIVELLGFIQRVSPSNKSKKKTMATRHRETNLSISTDQINKIASETVRTEVTADFHRLNVLLLRGVRKNGKVEARKVGTATMTGAHIQASLGAEISVEGHLGGLQVVDLTPEGSRHSKVFSVGHDPELQQPDQPNAFLSTIEQDYVPEEMYRTAFEPEMFGTTEVDINSANKAFYVSFHKPRTSSLPNSPLESTFKSGFFMDSDMRTPSMSPRSTETSGTELKLRMASLCYIHSPRFIAELSTCANDFKMYTSSLATSIKQAATEVAKGIVTKKDYLTTSLGPAGFATVLDSPIRKSTLSLSESLEGGEIAVDDYATQNKLKLDIVMQTPVVAFPRTSTSSELLVGHLGKIYLHNTGQRTGTESDAFLNEQIERMYVEIRNINVFSINDDYINRWMHSVGLKHTSDFLWHMMTTRCGDSILHNTTIELTIDQIPADMQNLSHDEATNIHFEEQEHEPPQNVLKVTGKVVTPLKVVLAKRVYEQVLQTLDNLTFDGTVEGTVLARDDASINPVSATPSLSSLQSEDLDPDRKTVRFEEEDITPSSDGLPSPSQDARVKIQADFSLPVLDVTLHDDFGDGNQGFVELAFKDFQVNMEKATPHTTSIQVALGSLIMEDLLQHEDSKHRFLMVSTAQQSQPSPLESHTYLSTSCPIKVSSTRLPVTASSLPTSLLSKPDHKTRKVTSLHGPPRSRSATYSNRDSDAYPATPPPSVRESREDLTEESSHNALVHINVLLVDRKSPEFHTTYRGINRLVDVDFNSLETTVNLQTWVVLLTFLNIGTPKGKTTTPVDSVSSARAPSSDSSVEIIKPFLGPAPEEEEKNSEFDIKVQSLTLLLNKANYELARASVGKLSAHLELVDGNTSIAGSLGHVSLTDLTPHGKLYRERFITTGEEALGFDIFKYGQDDIYLARECDVKVKLRMSSVRYVHTHRFQSEIVAFFEHFNNLHNHMGSTMAISKGKDVEMKDSRKTASRIILDIEAASPVILFPKNSSSSEVLVVNLGNLTVKNEFLYAGQPGTKSVILKDIDVPTEIPSSAQCFDQKRESSAEGVVYTMKEGPFGTLGEPKPSPTSVQSESGLSQDITVTDMTAVKTASQTRSDSNTQEPLSSPGVPVQTSSSSQSSSSQIPYHSLSTTDPSSSATDSSFRMWHVSSSASEGTPSPLAHRCLLDVMHIDLEDMDLYSAERTEAKERTKEVQQSVMVFPSCIVQRKGGKLLKEKCILKLQVERNLNADYSRIVPNFSINGMLSSVHCSMDIMQYNLIRGFLDKNLGEPLEEFEKPVTSYSQEPVGQTILSGTVWPNISMTIELDNVSLEFLISHEQPNIPEASLAKIDFIKSKFSFENFSDSSKTVDLVSHAIVAHDTRFRDMTEDSKPNVFLEILCPTKHKSNPQSLQMELHYRSTSDFSRFTVLLNNMRVMGIFDWLLALKDFLGNKEDKEGEDEDDFQPVTLNVPKDSTKTTPKSSKPTQHQKDMFPNLVQDKAAVDLSPKELSGVRREVSPSGSSTGSASGSRCSSPVNVSSGIVTKRAPVPEEPDKPFEMKLNITETEFVVVENMACWDTNAVILKSTAVMTYRPSGTDKPMSCSLQSLEVFSCNLSSEEETALSIIDPVTVSMELNSSPTFKKSTGLLDATPVADAEPSLEVQLMQTLNIRLSYHDIKLFMAIMNSLPKQATQAVSQDSLHRPASPLPYTGKDESFITILEDLGFAKNDCIRALETCNDRLDVAATWLLENAVPLVRTIKLSKKQDDAEEGKGKSGFSLSGIEVRASSVCICLIDDCKDCDVPLAELSLNNPYFLQRLHDDREGHAHFSLSGEYYNRNFSGWEPFLEPWRCNLKWKEQPSVENSPRRLVVHIDAQECLDFNLTSSLMELYSNTKKQWTEDYYNMTSLSSEQKRRQPFVPYALRNHTGCKLEFATDTSLSTRSISHLQPSNTSQDKISEWMEVPPGGEMPFVFESHGKIRHKTSHDIIVHQIVVRPDGWKETSPVSVDKVGMVFRSLEPSKPKKKSSVYSDKLPARVVFDITLEGSARKVVTVRSSLMVVSRVHVPMELRLTHPSNNTASDSLDLPVLKLNESIAIPMDNTHWNMYVRPGENWGVDYCETPIHWRKVAKPGDSSSSIVECLRPSSERDGTFRLCANIRRDGFPADIPGRRGSDSPRVDSAQLAGHTIILLPPVVITNLLPYDLRYYIKGTDIRGLIKPGKDKPVYQADLSQATEFGFQLDNYPKCDEVMIPENFYREYKLPFLLKDSRGRKLYLNFRIEPRAGKSLKISVSAPYWLINKSGLPLIFRQDGGSTEAAGQSEEYEMARSLAPFLFCYLEKDRSYLCTMRLGKELHQNGTPNGCSKFSLEGGTGVRSLHVLQGGGRPDWVYNIGFHIRKGLGRYFDTQMVTFVPRYQLDNRTRHKLAYSQKYFAERKGTDNEKMYLSALPGSSVYFHWPRDDLDRLLCVRIMDIPDCKWSGGFRTDKTVSLHINMRGSNGACILLNVEITMKSATYFVVFTDADQFPPPYRIVNKSEVSILYYQSAVADMSLRTIIKPKTSVPYALDESILPPIITLAVQGGSQGSYHINKSEEGEKLFYENFIYIAFLHTFTKTPEAGIHHHDVIPETECRQLVLDVCEGKVVLKKKTPGKRSQLWRMTSNGLLRHEGSSPPRDPRKTSSTSIDGLVLDSDHISFSASSYIPLTLSKPDERRGRHQTWFFTEEGLHCGPGSVKLFVQAHNGILQEGNIAVLGPGDQVIGDHPPPKQNVDRQKLRPGSGVLVVNVETDGPTRVLTIEDINLSKRYQQRQLKEKGVEEFMTANEREQRRQRQLSTSSYHDGESENTDKELQVIIKLPGFGISIVNKAPEELMYTSFRDIDVDFTRTLDKTSLVASIFDIQVDNQLTYTHRSPTLFVTSDKADEETSVLRQPALHIRGSKLHSKVPTYEIYQQCMLTVKKMTLIIEELLLFKLLEFAGYGQSDAEMEKMDESQQKTLAAEKQAKRYYFENLTLHETQIKLSMLRGKLPSELQTLKTKLGIPLVGFEDAYVDVDHFIRIRPFNRRSFLISEIIKHYTEELKSQAAKILGSVDFLGNPVGLLSDVAGGVSDLVKHGDVVGLVGNVTHGVSNSAAKVTGSLSDGIGTIAFDSKHQEIREVIRSSHRGRSRDHFYAGLKGLGFGIVGGLTSVFTQTYEGASQDGVEGLIKGLGKGVLGTVTKPAAGVLDFASGTAAAVRDSSKSSQHQPRRVRKPRCCVGPEGTLIRYTSQSADGQEKLLQLNDGDPTERFFSFEKLRSGGPNKKGGTLFALVSSKGVYFLGGDEARTVVLQTQYSEFCDVAQHINKDDKNYIELRVRADTEMGLQPENPVKRPQVVCDSVPIAQKVTQLINYAKNQYDELNQALTDVEDDTYLKLQL
ncbi:LOW QUALITY PROTEIN: intermembrane lipid transfer protein VPS13D-like [Ptychodera flava]|uniref:LOW QUALITY PROTEIN: intermembrane lipid transfer protein VPS13D-like n=1 Tax=Ptychodera flava TaxID=63121 RepID=UPI00396A16C6